MASGAWRQVSRCYDNLVTISLLLAVIPALLFLKNLSLYARPPRSEQSSRYLFSLLHAMKNNPLLHALRQRSRVKALIWKSSFWMIIRKTALLLP